MKQIRFLLLPFFLLFGLLLAFTPVFKTKTVVFFGDSITQAGVKPGGYIDVLN
ncbi:MAG: G-D-S-L family lipolytic protein, partial [Bacteroidota bacterium]|nr:G-D-S-L family lipolytic protein [Bacteroidota bacterium]